MRRIQRNASVVLLLPVGALAAPAGSTAKQTAQKNQQEDYQRGQQHQRTPSGDHFVGCLVERMEPVEGLRAAVRAGFGVRADLAATFTARS